MNLLKAICIVSCFFISVSSYSMANKICVNSTANYRMFGSVRWSDFLNTSFIMAFEDEKFSNFIIESANNESQLLKQISKVTENQCTIILGLFTSQDCLMTGNILKKNKAIALSPSCSNEQIRKFYPHIYSMTPEQLNYSKAVASFINKDAEVGTVYAFYQPSDIYSRDGLKHFINNMEKKIISVEVKTNGNFDLTGLKNKQHEKTYYVFFTYPLPSTQIISKLDRNKLIDKDKIIIGASSWIYQLSVFYPIKSILKKTERLLTPNLIDKNKVTHSSFTSKFEKKFHRKPDVVEILTYDATRLSIECYRYAKSHNNSKSDFLKCLQNGPHKGISGETYFSKKSPFAQREVYIDNMMDKL